MKDELLTLLAVLLIFVIVPLSPAMLLAVLLHPATFWEWIAVIVIGAILYLPTLFVEFVIIEIMR